MEHNGKTYEVRINSNGGLSIVENGTTILVMDQGSRAYSYEESVSILEAICEKINE